jgi:putative holliday junction resolvase
MAERNSSVYFSKLPAAGRLLALDVGSVRMGVAVSDSARRVASSRPIVRRTTWALLKADLAKLAEGCVGIVVGNPLNMDGTSGVMVSKISNLANLIETELGLPVLLADERLSSQQAEAAYFEKRTAYSRQTRASKADSSGQIDSSAAVIILQTVLDGVPSVIYTPKV